MSEISTKLNYSDFDFFKINLPDGSTRIFTDEKSFSDFCDCFSDYWAARSQSVLSSSISTILGVSSAPVLPSF
jgi:hypothetical protein